MAAFRHVLVADDEASIRHVLTLVLTASGYEVRAVGFALLAPQGAWVFTGDTAPNPALWQRLRELSVAHLVIETAFRNDEHLVAAVSRHLHPQALGRELTGKCVWIGSSFLV